jgi:hypothetical protein
MKKMMILFTMLFATTYSANSQSNNDFGSYLSYFKKTESPVSTRNYMKRKRVDKKIIPENLDLKYLCKNDTSKMHYFLELTDMETQKTTFSGYITYVTSAAEYYYFNDFVFTTYERSRRDEGEQYYLSSFTKTGLLCDSLLVLSSNDEGEWVDWTCSKILKDKIIVFHYSGDYIKKMETEITISAYQVDDKTGKFILKKQETVESKCTIDDFNGNGEKCLNEDPYNRY